MPTYHFVAKVPPTAYTIIEAETEEEAILVANSSDREVLYEAEDGRAKWLMGVAWVIREVDEGPQDIRLRHTSPIHPIRSGLQGPIK